MIPFDSNDDGITLTGASDTLPRALKESYPTIERLRKRFDEARQDTNENRTKAQRDRDYYDGPKQLDSDVRRILELRKQPPIYTNRVRPAVNGVLGVLQASRVDPKGYPRNPDDEQVADVCTKTLRYIADESHFADTKQDVAENFFIEGTGAVIIEMDGDKIVPTQIRWEEFYFDPYSRRPDLKDARYMGVAKWIDADTIMGRYADRIKDIGDPLRPNGIGGDTWDDRPNNAGLGWVDRNRRRLMLVEEYCIQDGQWMRLIYIGAGVLEYDVSPWLDERRQPCNPIEAVSCYIDRENGRYGMVRDMIPIQDEVNASRSRSLHLMNSRQVQQTDPAAIPVDASTAREEAAKADGVIPPGWQIVSTAEQTQANFVRMQEAKNEIERMGPTPNARDLEQGSAVSGRARQISQQAGLTELARPLAKLNAWELRCYRQMWNRAKQFWNDPMWIRVTDELQAPQFLKINEPVMGQVMVPVTDPATGQPAVDPMTGQPMTMPGIGPVDYKNRIAEMDMDIILDVAPDTVTLQQEVFAELLDLIRAGVDPLSPQFQFLLELSPMSDKGRALERLKALKEEMAQQQAAAAEAQQRQQQIEEAQKAADIQDTQAGTAKTLADTANVYYKMGQQSVPDPIAPEQDLT